MKTEIISTFKEKPKTKIGWWALWLGLASVLIVPVLNFFAAVMRPLIDKAAGESVGMTIGFGLGAISIPLSIVALVIGILALRKGERSWVTWVGFILAALVAAFWAFMVAGEFLFPH